MKSSKLKRAHRIVEALKDAGLDVTVAQELECPPGSYLIEVGPRLVSLEVYHDRALMKSQGFTPDCRLVHVGKKLVPEADVVATVLKQLLKAA